MSKPIRAISCETTSAVNDFTLPLPGLSPVAGKSVVAKFDGGSLSSDGGVLALREVEQRLSVADRLAACIEDPRAPDLITHTLSQSRKDAPTPTTGAGTALLAKALASLAPSAFTNSKVACGRQGRSTSEISLGQAG